MNIYSSLQIGAYHTNHCEDYLFVGSIGHDRLLCAVLDGCTMGIDSYFVSTLAGKLLRKIAKEKEYEAFYNAAPAVSLDSSLKAIVSDLFRELSVARNHLMLEQKELLTTLLLLIFDEQTKQGIILAIGDGLASVNGEIFDFDQENKPDYLGFHLSENFEEWYACQTQKITFENAHDISIATDGIFTFTPVTSPKNALLVDPVSFLIVDQSLDGSGDLLQLKLKKMEHQFGLQPTDDLAIIRLIL
ncbi:MAG: stage II sporulation protein E (SpoIIE) [Cytophagaceae bacterium]|nr:MAG: stage II sporulation protein E (SpoIIE) [Cytophagaceae bacterium]